MAKLEAVSGEDLRDWLGRVESAKAAKRLMIALAYKDDEPATALSERYGVPLSTVYYWLDRFENRSIEDAIEDEPRPGRPSKLDEEGRAALADDLDDPPSASGYDADEWTPELVRDHLEREYDVSYSLGHVRRLVGQIRE